MEASLVLIGRGPVADRPSIVSFVGVPAVVYPSDWVSVAGVKKTKKLVLFCLFVCLFVCFFLGGGLDARSHARPAHLSRVSLVTEVKIQTTSKNSQRYYTTKRLKEIYYPARQIVMSVRANFADLFTGNARQRYAKRNGIGVGNKANWLVDGRKPV